MNTAEPISSQDLNFLAEAFRLQGSPSRRKILLHCEDSPKSVTDISEALELSQSLVSHHLRLLRGARLVTRVRHSKQMFYEVTDRHVGGGGDAQADDGGYTDTYTAGTYTAGCMSRLLPV